MHLFNNPKRVICVLPNGKGIPMAKRLNEEKGIQSINIHTGRGRSTAVSEAVSFGQYAEVDIISVVVEEEIADEIFEFIFFEADINKPHGGFIYMAPAEQATAFTVPDFLVGD